MENASKALLIAGAILIVIILISIMLIVRNNVADFYASEEQLQATEDKTKFNEQFTRFNRNDVQGYELISLVNKVVDYNERVSDASQNGNDIKAKPIKLIIDIDKEEVRKSKFSYDGNKLYLFTTQSYTQSDSKEEFQSKIEEKIRNLVNDYYKNEEVAKNVTKNIQAIFLSNEDIQTKINNSRLTEQQIKKEAIDKYNSLMRDDNLKINTNDITYGWSLLTQTNGRKDAIYAYYEYSQFKKAYFKCTKLHYDEQTGKVDELDFKFTGKIE